MTDDSLTDTQELQQRNRELTILNAIAEALNREVNLPQALQTALRKVAELFNLETGWIWLLHEQTNRPYLAVAQNLPPLLTENPRLMDGTRYCYCLEDYQSGNMEDAANISMVTCTRLKSHVKGKDTLGLKAHASVPLYAHHKPLGILNVASTDWRELTPNDLRLLTTIGDLIGMAIERARLFQRSVELGALEERNRLAREIHDTLAQSLVGIALQLETAEVMLETQQIDSLTTPVHQALLLTRRSLEEARRSVLDLRAAPLEGKTVIEAIATLVDEMNAQYPLKIAFLHGEQPPLTRRIEIGLYRVVQESLTNIVKHADAGEVTLELTAQPHSLHLMIQDDGSGFDPKQVQGEHFGLVGLNERVKLLGGTLELCSTVGHGTRLEVTIPLENLL